MPVDSQTHEQLLAPVVRAGQLGCVLDPASIAHRKGEAEAILGASPALLYARLTEAFMGRYPELALELLRELGLLELLLPELHATIDLSQEGGRRHKDVWAHTKTVVWQSVPGVALRWAAVLHDIGKVPTRRFVAPGKVTFYGHAEVGERMFLRTVARRIAFPPGLKVEVGQLIRYHLRPGQYEASWSDAALRRFAQEVGPGLDDLLNLSRADITTKHAAKRRRCLRKISELAQRIRVLRAEDAKPKALPAGLGHQLMCAFELQPGPQVGQLRARLKQAFEAGELEGGREPDYYVDAVRVRGWAL